MQHFNSLKNHIPCKTGIGLRPPHYQEIAFGPVNSALSWVEIHPENFFSHSGMGAKILEKIAENYPLSMHGVGLSLGSATGIDPTHLAQLKILVDHYQPGLVSEHISWSKINDIVLNDLLPLPYTHETLTLLVTHIDQVQNTLKRQILIENPSTYLNFTHHEMPEYELLKQVALQSGCGILLDINNIYVTQQNHGLSAHDYLQHMPKKLVHEYHLAGHAVMDIDGQSILIDHHGDKVCDEVWQLYQQALNIIGPKPTLIEWDTNIPALEILLAESNKANQFLQVTCHGQ